MLVEDGTFESFRVSIRAIRVVVLHLQFTDDMMFLLGATRDNVVAFKNLLTWFDVVFGLRINLSFTR